MLLTLRMLYNAREKKRENRLGLVLVQSTMGEARLAFGVSARWCMLKSDDSRSSDVLLNEHSSSSSQ